MKVIALILILVALAMIGGCIWQGVKGQPAGADAEALVEYWLGQATQSMATWFVLLGLGCVVVAIPGIPRADRL